MPSLPLVSRNACAEPYFADDFSGMVGWPVGEDASYRLQYTGERYEILVKQPYDGIAVTAGAKAADFFLSVEAQDYKWGDAYGVNFAIPGDWSQSYEVLFSRDSFSVWRGSGGSWTMLQGWTYSNKISKTKANKLGILRQGSRINVYINGAQVVSLEDSTLSGLKRLGLVVYSDSSGMAKVAYDNFSLTETACFLSSPADWLDLPLSGPMLPVPAPWDEHPLPGIWPVQPATSIKPGVPLR
jgi:hypothetical protein